MSESPIIDSAALDRLREWGGEKLLGQMVKLFLENSEVRMNQIRGGVQTGDIDMSQKGSHSLKSSAANVGAESVRRLAAEIEGASSRGDAESIARLLPELEDAYGQARAALQTVKGEVSE